MPGVGSSVSPVASGGSGELVAIEWPPSAVLGGEVRSASSLKANFLGGGDWWEA